VHQLEIKVLDQVYNFFFKSVSVSKLEKGQNVRRFTMGKTTKDEGKLG